MIIEIICYFFPVIGKLCINGFLNGHMNGLLSSNMIGLGVMVFSVVLFVALHTIFLFEFGFELDVLRLIIMFPLLYILLCFETNCIWSWVAN